LYFVKAGIHGSARISFNPLIRVIGLINEENGGGHKGILHSTTVKALLKYFYSLPHFVSSAFGHSHVRALYVPNTTAHGPTRKAVYQEGILLGTY
jgi:hypothetical protein